MNSSIRCLKGFRSLSPSSVVDLSNALDMDKAISDGHVIFHNFDLCFVLLVCPVLWLN